MGIAKGSAGEVKYQLMLAKDLGYINTDIYKGLGSNHERISQILTGLAKSLK